jgi:putative phosphoribosyl transferase
MQWMEAPLFRDRQDAGRALARELEGYRGTDAVVLGAPRGGVAVALPVALELGAPLDVVLARKLPAPGNPELGFGAVGEGGVQVVDREIVALLGLGEEEIEAIAERVRGEVEERATRYRRRRAAIPLEGRTALVIDDGVATGVTLAAAVDSARSRGAREVVAAAPVSSTEGKTRVEGVADRFICPHLDPLFIGVGVYYRDFPQLTDEDVVRLLEAAPGGAGR